MGPRILLGCELSWTSADSLRGALALGWSDFEDAVCVRAAVESGCHLVATRDPRGFRGAPLPVFDAAGPVGVLLGASADTG